MTHRVLVALLLVPAGAATEPVPRPLKPLPLKVSAPLVHVSAAHEIRDGRVLITNAKGASVVLLDPAKGSLTAVGSAGGGADRYAAPGGLYAGLEGTTLLVDRAQTRLFTISATGELQGSRSIARRGVTSASDADVDRQRVDARGLTYFLERHRPGIPMGAAELPLVRLNADTQQATDIVQIRQPEMKTVAGGDGVTFGRAVIGSPADGWGVAPDGRVAVVRADPYRVEWHAPDGKVTRGPMVEHTPIVITEAEKEHLRRTRGRGSVGVGPPGGATTNSAGMGMLFAATKAPFDPEDILVSPDARVWVLRSQLQGAATVVYDVFDHTGRRVDRIELPGGSRIVGFGAAAVYVRHNDDGGRCELRKYGWK